MRQTYTTIIWIVFVTVAAATIGACGGSQASDKSKRKSDRFYEAASISWFQQQDTLAAIRSLTRSIEANPENDDAHYLLGIIRFSRGEYDAAKGHFEKTIEIRKANDPAGLAGVQNNLGLLLIHEKKYEEAIVLLKAASEEVLNREPWLAMGNLGWVYIELGEHDKAIEILKRALFDQPKYCVGMYRLGQAYYMKRDYETAAKNLESAISVPEPGCDRIQEAHHLLGMCYLRQENDTKAKESLTRCAEINPDTETGVACTEALTGL